MSRRTLALLLGVALPTVLLGAGWLWATVRERDALEREERARLARVADVVRAAVDESLEELRRREDERPFYLYNHYYSPPDVLAISDPVAVSPLSREPSDPRIVGYFQIDPDGAIRTPYAAEPDAALPERGRRVLEVAHSEALASLRDEIRGDVNPALVPTAPAAVPGLAEAARPIARRPPTAAAGDGRAPWQGEQPGSGVDDAVAGQAEGLGPGGSSNLAPEGPLPVSLNQWGQEVFNDIQQAYGGDEEANLRVQRRGRSVPQTRRNVVDWEEVSQQQAPSQATSAAQGSSARQASTAAARRRQASNRAARRQARAQDGDGGGSDPPAPVPPPLPVIRGGEADIDYTPMAWRAAPDALLLHRLVSHEGAAVVQAVVLDRDELISRWLPELLSRHAVEGVEPAVLSAGEGAVECGLREPASRILDGVDLCFPEAALASVTARVDEDLHREVGALLGLLFVVGLAGVVIHRAARRSEELSRQKSAFVSAVSHELRTPLTTIRMHAEMLRDGLVSDAKRPRFHDDLVNESVRLSHLVENVLEISRIEEGRRPFKPREGDLVAQVRALVEEQRPFVEAKGFEIRAPGREEPLDLSCDWQGVEQIVVNLIDNAVKYGRGAQSVVEVEVARDGERAVIRVMDRGPGVPEAERARVFRRFHRVERPETAHMPGTGIGLALVRDLAAAHGGEAEIRPREGGGAEVIVSLPIRD